MSKITTSIEPWFSVNNSAKAAAFYKDAFGAVETYRMETPDGGLVVKLAVDGAAFWVSGQSTGEEENMKHDLKQENIKIVLTVDDPDTVFDRAIKAGGAEVFAVGEDFGWRLGRLTDPFGLDWEIGKPLATE